MVRTPRPLHRSARQLRTALAAHALWLGCLAAPVRAEEASGALVLAPRWAPDTTRVAVLGHPRPMHRIQWELVAADAGPGTPVRRGTVIPPATAHVPVPAGAYHVLMQDWESGVLLSDAPASVRVPAGATEVLAVEFDRQAAMEAAMRGRRRRAAQPLQAGPSARAGEVLVRFAPETPLHRLHSLCAQAGATIRKRGHLTGIYRLGLAADGDPDAVLAYLRAQPEVLHAEPARAYSLLTLFPPKIDSLTADERQWPRHEHPHDRDLNLPEAWSLETGSDSVLVVVVDSGADTTHPDLAGRFWHNDDPPGDADADGDPDDDANGFVDDYSGWYFNSDGFDGPDIQDRHGHGTHIAGICGAGALAGTPGVVGVAWSCPLVVVRLDFGDNTDLEVAEAILYGAETASAHGMRCVINMSFGITEPSEAVAAAIARAYSLGAVLVAAAGNQAAEPPTYPAAFAEVIAVGNLARTTFDVDGDGAADPVLRIHTSSSHGAQIDVAAPGTRIWSCLPSYPVYLTTLGYRQGADYLTGTSQAAAFVSGVAALVLSRAHRAGLELSPEDVRTILSRSARYGDGATAPYLHDPNRDRIPDTDTDLATDWSGAALPRNDYVGMGAVDAHRALGALLLPEVELAADPPAHGAVRLHATVRNEGVPVRQVVFRVGDWQALDAEAPFEAVWDGAGCSEPAGCLATAEAYDTFADMAAIHGTPALTPGVSLPLPVQPFDGVLSEVEVVHALELPAGWSLISLPVAPTDSAPAGVFFDLVGIYSFSGSGYRPATALVPGVGYWVNLGSGGVYAVRGREVVSLRVPLAPGWNLVGARNAPETLSSAGLDPPQPPLSLFDFQAGEGYRRQAELAPWRGYWLHVAAAGTLNLGPR